MVCGVVCIVVIDDPLWKILNQVKSTPLRLAHAACGVGLPALPSSNEIITNILVF